jgi:hypothetical protein
MVRNIYIVNATIVDANGAYATLTGYPKTFDSRNYNGDSDKALKRAEGEFCEVWGAFCKRDDRQVQTVTLSMVNGKLIDRKSMGDIAQDPDPEPEPQPEPEEPEQ